MPDREIFDRCSARHWNVAFRAIFSDENDPNAVSRSVEALMPMISGNESGLERLVEVVEQECAPPSLFREPKHEPKAVLRSFAVELRDVFDRASSETIRHLHPSAKQSTKEEVLACVLSFATRQLAENSCAIVVAKADLGKDDEWIQNRLDRLESDLISSREIRDLARSVLRHEVSVKQQSRAPRRRTTDMAELINLPNSR